MVNVTQILVNTLVISSLYALVAIGFTLIFGVAGVFNLAHGAMVALGGFTAYFVSTKWGFSIYIALLAATIVPGIISAILYLSIIEPVEDNDIAVLILTLLTAFVIKYLFGIFETKTTFSIPQVAPGKTTLEGFTILNNSIFVFVASWVLIIGLFYVINRTDMGRAILAMNMDKKGSLMVGINLRRLKFTVWILASVFAGFAGVLLTSYRTGQWDMGLQPLMLSFSIVILGGLGSIRGSVIAAYIIGFIEVFTTSVIDSELTGVVSLLLLIVILLIRPQGLFGREVSA